MGKAKVSCRVVVITVHSNAGLKSLIAPPPLDGVEKCNHYQARNKRELKESFEKVMEGDILVINAHANENFFVYGRTPNPVYWSGDEKNPGCWEELGMKKPPKLAALVIASCMKGSDEEAITPARLRAIRSAFNTRILIAPKATYQNQTKDHIAMDAIIKNIRDFYAAKIDGADLNEKINRRYDRMRVSFGCNGRNHPDGCICRFGPKWSTTR